MSERDIETDSVGRIDAQVATIALPAGGMALSQGGVLSELTVAYESYGQLNAARDNVIFICHALTGDAHAAGLSADGTPGWWDSMIGPGKGIDTRYYFVVCANILGGCKGTTGPASLNPATGQPYASAFPAISVSDMVDAHRLLCDHLGIARLAALIGGSFGGMQVMDWMIRFPDMVSHAVAIASTPSLSAQALAFDTLARNAITADPNWQGGDYYGTGLAPDVGLAQARKLGHITYGSQDAMNRKFGRDRRGAHETSIEPLITHGFQSNFQIESYLEYKGQQFVERFDANSYLHVTRAMDDFDLCEDYGSLEKAFAAVTSRVLVVAVSSDWLFPPGQSRAVAHALLRNGHPVSYCELTAPHGHDAFLIDVTHLSEVLRAFLPWVAPPAADADAVPSVAPPPPDSEARRQRYAGIIEMVPPAARLLDIGCGRGELLAQLGSQRDARGVGVDIDIEQIIRVIDRGHAVFQLDVDDGLRMIPADSYDYVILSDILQMVRHPRQVLAEMLRVAPRAIVGFPNFGYYGHRLQLVGHGRMPVGGVLPHEWYNTPNIHLFTYRDFLDLCEGLDAEVTAVRCFSHTPVGRLLCRVGLRNIGAEQVLMTLTRRSTATSTKQPKKEHHDS